MTQELPKKLHEAADRLNSLLMRCHNSITGALDNVKMAKRFACAKGLLKDNVGNLSRDMRLALVYDEPPHVSNRSAASDFSLIAVSYQAICLSYCLI